MADRLVPMIDAVTIAALTAFVAEMNRTIEIIGKNERWGGRTEVAAICAEICKVGGLIRDRIDRLEITRD